MSVLAMAEQSAPGYEEFRVELRVQTEMQSETTESCGNP